MTRVSLKEAYDNKDVVAQIYAIRDIAEGASDTADNAVTTANDAKTYVDTLGAQVEGAVQTANNASASAQASAQTVSQYDGRLTEVEGGLNQAESDIDGLETGLGAVTVRIQTAEGDIDALETADAQNVKINNINAYAVGLTGNQPDIRGYKKFINEPYIYGVFSELKQYGVQTAFLRLFTTGNYTKKVLLDVIDSTGSGRGTIIFAVTSNEIMSEVHTIQIGGLDARVGIVRIDSEYYLTLSGYCVFANIYIRSGGNRRVTPVEINPVIDVSDTELYPNQVVVTW